MMNIACKMLTCVLILGTCHVNSVSQFKSCDGSQQWETFGVEEGPVGNKAIAVSPMRDTTHHHTRTHTMTGLQDYKETWNIYSHDLLTLYIHVYTCSAGVDYVSHIYTHDSANFQVKNFFLTCYLIADIHGELNLFRSSDYMYIKCNTWCYMGIK